MLFKTCFSSIQKILTTSKLARSELTNFWLVIKRSRVQIPVMQVVWKDDTPRHNTFDYNLKVKYTNLVILTQPFWSCHCCNRERPQRWRRLWWGQWKGSQPRGHIHSLIVLSWSWGGKNSINFYWRKYLIVKMIYFNQLKVKIVTADTG